MGAGQADKGGFSPFVRFSHEEWGGLRGATPLALSEADVRDPRRIDEHVSPEEVRSIYLPSRGS